MNLTGLILANPVTPDEFEPDDTFDPSGGEADALLGYLAWSVTATAIGGLLLIGIQMALQLRRGEPGEGSVFFRGGAVVAGACLLGVTAGPLVDFVVDPYLVR
ncbi:hypothetical protein [Streptomyces sp. NPDC004134]|uniref:hypothetical protein n=1 Tax=Streptomyces sp. NPDC004134 TaxID=3364691 RepID=UPI0036A8D177